MGDAGRRTSAALAAGSVLALLGCLLGGCGGGLCDAGDLILALAAAGPGDRVELGACTISGHFTVGPGVTLAGQGSALSRLVSLSDNPVVDLSPGPGSGTSLEQLSVDSAGRYGVRTQGLGAARLLSVDVLASRGVALGAQGLDRLSLHAVRLVGPVVSASPAADAARFGLVLVSVAEAELRDVAAESFRRAGVLAVQSQLRWTTGGVRRNLGAGLLVEGGGATLDRVDLEDTLADNQRLRTWSGVFFAGATVSSSQLRVLGSGGFGLLHAQTAEVTHQALVAEDNSDAALWLDQVPAFRLLGGSLARNGFAGLFAHRSADLTVNDLEVGETRIVTRVLEVGGVRRMGDGVQLVESTQAVRLERISLTHNERAGLLVDLGGTGSTAGLTLSAVQVTVTQTTAFGAVAQNGTVLPGWDAQVTRVGVTPAMDAMGGLPAAGAVGPCEAPAETRLDQLGLDAALSL